jgi:hypothetical protein
MIDLGSSIRNELQVAGANSYTVPSGELTNQVW